MGQGIERVPVKETLVALLRAEQGYDVISACEEADRIIRAAKSSGWDTNTYRIGNKIVTLSRK